jgi:hypothetical protein
MAVPRAVVVNGRTTGRATVPSTCRGRSQMSRNSSARCWPPPTCSCDLAGRAIARRNMYAGCSLIRVRVGRSSRASCWPGLSDSNLCSVHSSSVDWQSSRTYSDRLNTYFTRIVSPDGQFICPDAAECRNSAPGVAGGQLFYVGDAYACSVDGRSFRVLVVSMQVGDAEAPVTMARRTEQVLERVPQRPGQRNPHMRGVTRALQLLHGLTINSGDERLADGTHVLRAYAMPNSVLCSALPTGGKSRRGSPTSTMLENCAPHLKATLLTLEPTILQVQGAGTLAAIERISTTSSGSPTRLPRSTWTATAWCAVPPRTQRPFRPCRGRASSPASTSPKPSLPPSDSPGNWRSATMPARASPRPALHPTLRCSPDSA